VNIFIRIGLVLVIIFGADIAVRAPIEKLYGPSLLASTITLLAALLVCYAIDRHLHKKRLAQLVDQSPINNPDLGESTCLRLSRAQERELHRLSSMHIFVRTAAVFTGGALAIAAALMTSPGFMDRFHSAPSTTFRQFFDQQKQSRERVSRDVAYDLDALDKHAHRTAAQIDRALTSKNALKDSERELLELGKFAHDYTKTAGQQYDKAVDACGDLLDFKSITSREDLTSRIRKIGELEKSVNALEEVTRTLPRELRAKAAESTLSAADQDAFLKAFTRSYQLELRLEAITHEKVFCATAGAILKVLDQQWGRWHVDPATGELVIENATAADQVAVLLKGIQTAAKRSDEVRQAMTQALANVGN